ncbi:DUF167 domain-containing protein [Limibacillus halophilus]|jgi:uncharacterized protein (TIGR00251 family)
MSAEPYRTADGGLLLFVRLQPGASRAQLGGLREGAEGKLFLEARVTAPPEGGKANVALIKLLAKEFGLAKSAVTLCAGHAAREKTLLLEGDPQALAAKLEALLSR